MARASSTSRGNGSEENSAGSRRRFIKGATAVAGGGLVGLAGCTGGGDGGGSESNGGGGDSSATMGSATSGGDGKLADKINVYTFGGANAEGIKKAYIDGFSEKYGVEVNHQTIASGWDLIPKIKNDSVTAHVVEQNPGSVLGGIPGVWKSIRLDNVPHVLDNLKEKRLRGDSKQTTFDPGKKWHYAPKEIWAQGLTYNHDKMDEPKSWMDLYRSELKGRLAYTGFVSLALGVAGSEAGVDFTKMASDSSVAKTVWDRIAAESKYVYKWWESGSSAQQLLTRGSADAGNFWYGRVVSLRENQNAPLSYTIPEEGTVMGVSCWTVGVGEDPGRYTAEKFIDYQARPEPSQKYAKLIPYYQPYPVPNPPKAYAENPDKEHIDRLKLWDYKVVQKNRKQWSREFQKTLRG